uniref:Origin recognition complex subunit 6 n=1 Tax=Mycena chlorophos TaxID=658473 RepID=A0ABQ0LI02_MYCCL|nr:predicted protein [Mycena chlorophos]
MSGFDIGEDRIGLPAVCALLASTRLNNTHVSFEAAHRASCLNKNKFKRLQETVVKALKLGDGPTERPEVTFDSLRSKHCPHISTRCLRWMELVQKDLEDAMQDATSDEIKVATFVWVCNKIQPNEPLDIHAFTATYGVKLRKMRALDKTIDAQSGNRASEIVQDLNSVRVTRSSTSSPQKRGLPRSPQKPSVQLESPSKRPKLSVAPLTSPTKSSAARPASPRSQSPIKSPSKGKARVEPTPDDEDDEDEEEDELPPARRRRFRPVFRDTVQWRMRDPRLKKMDEDADALAERMVKLYGRPFEEAWQALEAKQRQSEDVEMEE